MPKPHLTPNRSSLDGTECIAVDHPTGTIAEHCTIDQIVARAIGNAVVVTAEIINTSPFLNKLNSNTAVKVAFIGDSLTHGFSAAGANSGNYLTSNVGNYPTGDDRGNPLLPSFVNQFRAWCTGRNAASTVHNYGLQATTAEWHVTNGTAGVVATAAPDVCFIMLGVNDCTFGHTPNDFRASLQIMIDELTAADIEVILIKEVAVHDAFSNLIEYDISNNEGVALDLNDSGNIDRAFYVYATKFLNTVGELAASNNLMLIDCWTPFNTAFETVGFLPSGLIYDENIYNVHPSDTGHTLIAATIINTLTGTIKIDPKQLIIDNSYNKVSLDAIPESQILNVPSVRLNKAWVPLVIPAQTAGSQTFDIIKQDNYQLQQSDTSRIITLYPASYPSTSAATFEVPPLAGRFTLMLAPGTVITLIATSYANRFIRPDNVDTDTIIIDLTTNSYYTIIDLVRSSDPAWPYFYVITHNMGQYINGGVGGIPEAPNDGKIYVRRNAAWEELVIS